MSNEQELMRYRKKPVMVDAIQWTGDNLYAVIAFTAGPPDIRSNHAGMKWEEYCDLVRREGLKIFTLEGKMSASIGDWIIKGVKGEFYPCKPDIFSATYEPEADRQQAVPSGYVMVPVVATEAMLAAAWRECSEGGKETYRQAWRAMVDESQTSVVKESLTSQPVAYAVFAHNGNIQIWSANPVQVETLRKQYGARLRPLFDFDYISALLAAGTELDNQLRQWLASEEDDESVAARESWRIVTAAAAPQAAPPAPDVSGLDQIDLPKIEGDKLPPVGSKVLIHLASLGAWVEHTVAGYYAWGDLDGNESLHRVFVRVRDSAGHLNARMLQDVRQVAAHKQEGK